MRFEFIETEEVDGILVISFKKSNIEVGDVEIARGEIESCIDACRSGKVMIDCAEIEYLEDALRQSFIKIDQLCSRRKVALCFCAFRSYVLESIRATNTHNLLTIADTRAEALDVLNVL